MERLKKLFENRNVFGIAVLAVWFLLWGIIFFVGNFLENILLFFVFYNFLLPVITVAECYILAKKRGIVYFVPAVMFAASVVFFAATELIRYALPNAVVIVAVCTFFASGIGSVMHGGKDEKKK